MLSYKALQYVPYPKGPCAHYFGTWDLGTSNYSTGLRQVYDYWVLGPLGLGIWGPGSSILPELENDEKTSTVSSSKLVGPASNNRVCTSARKAVPELSQHTCSIQEIEFSDPSTGLGGHLRYECAGLQAGGRSLCPHATKKSVVLSTQSDSNCVEFKFLGNEKQNPVTSGTYVEGILM